MKTMSPAGSEHGSIVAAVTVLLGVFAKAHHLGVIFGAETGFKIGTNPDTVRAPDLAFVRRERIPEAGIPRAFWPGAPDLAVEVVSPNDMAEEFDEKVADWLAAGTGAVWVVKPKRRTVTVYRTPDSVTLLSEGQELDGGEILPGFGCRVADLFAR